MMAEPELVIAHSTDEYLGGGKLDPRIDFIAGTLGGMAGIICGQPIDTVKVRMQTSGAMQRYTGTWNALATIIREEKVRGLFKGLNAPLIGQASLNGMVFATYSHLVQLQLAHKNDEATINQMLLAGAGSGLVASLVATPTELIKIRQQLMYTSAATPSATRVGLDIFRKHGIRGLYRGLTITALRECSYGVYFATYEGLCRFLKPRSPIREEGVYHASEAREPSLSWTRLVFAGGIAGVVSWIIIFPVDTIKSRIQSIETFSSSSSSSSKSLSIISSRSTIAAVVESYRELGMRGLCAGMTPTVLRAFPVNMVTFFVYEAVISICGGRTK
ncbi:hypothetical protein FRC03_001222 [Tulasnella sp. 419]|nr:hypothetical protein FRC03_001222 [Tulasnella sp. 419]